MKRKILLMICLCISLMTAGCDLREKSDSSEEDNGSETTIEEEDDDMERYLHLSINGTEVPVSWEDNDSVNELAALAAAGLLTVQMSMYGGFEQVGNLGTSIVRDDSQMTTAYGDIVLYSGNNIVIFYGSNSWAYTRLGHIGLSQKEMEDLLGHGDVEITLFR